MNYRHQSLYNYHVYITKAGGAYIYSASFSLDDKLTDRHHASGSAPSVAACIDNITEWREGVIELAALLDGDK